MRGPERSMASPLETSKLEAVPNDCQGQGGGGLMGGLN